MSMSPGHANPLGGAVPVAGAPPAVAPPNGSLNPLDQATSNQAGADRAKLTQDPVTGYWVDPSSRAVFQLTNGQYIPVHDPNATAIAARAIGAQSKYGGIAQSYEDALKATMAQQGSLADAYRRTISDPNAPSVARAQLDQALQAADATQLSQASGLSGQNAFLARRNASNNMAGLAANTDQSAALVRAQEVAAAQKGLGETLGAVAGEAGTAYGQNTGLGLNYFNTAANTETAGNANATAVRGQNIGVGEDTLKGATAGASGLANPAGAAA